MIPWQVSFAIVWLLNIGLLVYVFRLARRTRRLADECRELEVMATAAMMFANALAAKDIGIPCDDCGNEMGPSDPISIIPRPNGEVYVGHRSHMRHIDWGYE